MSTELFIMEKSKEVKTPNRRDQLAIMAYPYDGML